MWKAPQREDGKGDEGMNGVCAVCGKACTKVSKARLAKGYGQLCAEHSPNNRRPGPLTCLICGAVFEKRGGHGYLQFCSWECRRAAPVDLVNPRQLEPCRIGSRRSPIQLVAERDAWRCHICSKVVSPVQASVDHLVPRSHGGGGELTNLRLAHLKCNASRGPGRRPAQLLLIG